MRRHTEEEINIFNFSFLDILSCTIGALIFILLMIVLSTTDLVEKKLLDDIKGKHSNALTELAELEKLVEKRQKELSVLESEQATLKKYATKLKKAVTAKNKKIATLEEMLTSPGGFSLGKAASSIITTNVEEEAKKVDRGQAVLSNLEKKSITSAKGVIYLGDSTQAVNTKDSRELKDALKQFLRYYDDGYEDMFWIKRAGSEDSYERAIKTAASLKSSYADGLKAAKEKRLPDSSKAVKGKYSADLDRDGINEVMYSDNNGDGKWDLKHINTDRDDFWEEVYLNYDTSSGSWGMKLVDSDHDNDYDLLFEDTRRNDNDWEVKSVDPDLNSSKARARYEDKNNDGIYDIKFVNTDFNDDDWEQLNTEYNPRYKRWKASSIDIDGDGIPNVMWGDTDMKNNDWEEKFVDLDSDGEMDIRYKDLDKSNNYWEALYSKPMVSKNAWGEVLVDKNGDGSWDKKMLDKDGDGDFEEELDYNPKQ